MDRLCEGGPYSITRLTAGTGITRQAVTKHLAVLADVGLVRDTRRGGEHVWALDQERLAEVRRNLALISNAWDEALQRLKTVVEEGGEEP